MRRRVKVAIGCGLGLLALLIALILYIIVWQGGDTKALPYSPLDISQAADGTYLGSAETLLVKADVEVCVKAGALQGILITHHDTGLGAPAEAITNTMVAQNTLDVDAVSGATVSSKVIQSAVYDALAK